MSSKVTLPKPFSLIGPTTSTKRFFTGKRLTMGGDGID
jgi:hypothetical protein